MALHFINSPLMFLHKIKPGENGPWSKQISLLVSLGLRYCQRFLHHKNCSVKPYQQHGEVMHVVKGKIVLGGIATLHFVFQLICVFKFALHFLLVLLEALRNIC